jgi:glycine/D-amino acid oxidase-like deaminating enzyme
MNGDPRSHGLWEASAPAGRATAPLDARVEADVVVIGGGFTGTSAALHAAERGARVVVLEAVDIGFGAAGRNVGLVNAGMWVMPSVLLGELGDLHGERLLHALGDAPRYAFDLVARHGIGCEATPDGTLHCAVGASLRRGGGRAGSSMARARRAGRALRRRADASTHRDGCLCGIAARSKGRDDPAAGLRARPRAAAMRRRTHPHVDTRHRRRAGGR